MDVFTIENIQTISLKSDCSCEEFVSQLQQYTTKIICVINGKTMKLYDKEGIFPENINFNKRQKIGTVVCYYFIDNNNNEYCIFGRDNAEFFYPAIKNEVGKIISFNKILKQSNDFDIMSSSIIHPIDYDKPPIKNNKIFTLIGPNTIKIVDGNSVMTFPNPNYLVDIQEYN